MKKALYSFLLVICFTSCISEKELLSKYDTKKMFLNESINAIYDNKNVIEKYYNNLPDLLSVLYKPKLKEAINRELDSLKTKIEYDERNQLTISYVDTNETKKKFTLKVKNKGNYLSVRRKLLLIPIPFVFFIYRNYKALIFNDQEGNLHIINGKSIFGWIFITGGSRKIYENVYNVEK